MLYISAEVMILDFQEKVKKSLTMVQNGLM
jgi:hypothetical protein